jgi:deoxyribodipyrimidine photo-lyase
MKDLQEVLEKRGIKMVVRRGASDDIALEAVALEAGKDASLIVTDRGYMRPQKRWRKRVAGEAECPVTQVESDVVVPVVLASGKRETAARTLRSRTGEYLDDFLVGLTPTKISKQSLSMKAEGLDLSGIEKALSGMNLDRSVGALSHLYRGGTSEAKKLFRRFLEGSFDAYTEHRNQPQTDDVSHMSKYLHFGQISPIWLALTARRARTKKDNIESFVEELVVRRELSINFVLYTPDYDSYSNLPDWAKKTLEEHTHDEREYTYTRKQLESAETHDEYWNAAMKEMVHTGYMHNYMRMYWGKKILEWSNTPEYAYRTTLYLNNYFLDGRDPNSFANVAWIFGQHDRGWTAREVYGKVRYMSASGLERKARPDLYVEKVEKRIGASG